MLSYTIEKHQIICPPDLYSQNHLTCKVIHSQGFTLWDSAPLSVGEITQESKSTFLGDSFCSRRAAGRNIGTPNPMTGSSQAGPASSAP